MRVLAKPPPPGAVRMTLDEQTERWVRGESVHRVFDMQFVDKDGAVVGTAPWDECTPDFSCCEPALLAPLEVRQAFAAANERERSKLLGAFLKALLAHRGLGERVAIADERIANKPS